MQAPFSYDCFLSHNKQDKPQVRRLAERLRDAGLRVPKTVAATGAEA